MASYINKFFPNSEDGCADLIQFPESDEETQLGQLTLSRESESLPPIILYVQRRMIDGIPPEESRIHCVFRRSLQTTSVIAATGSRYPFIAINLKLGGDIIPYAVALTYGNLTSFAGLVAWSFLNMIDEYTEPMGEEERLLRRKKVNCTNTVILVSSIGVGVLSQVPFAYLAYVYNNNNPIMPLIMFATDSWFPIYSTNLSLRALAEMPSLKKFDQNLVSTRKKIIKLIEDNRQLLATDKEGRMDYLNALERIKNPAEYIGKLSKRRIEHDAQSSLCLTVAQQTVNLTGLALTASHMILIAYMSYEGAKLISDNPVADITTAGLVVGANLYLERLSIPRTAVRVFNMIKDALLCSCKPTLSDQFAPKLSFCLKAATLATAALSYGPSVQVSRDYFDGPFSYYMQVAVSCAAILLVSTALLDISDRIVEGYVVRRGSEEAKQIMDLNRKMQRFCRLLKESHLLEYARFLKALPQELFDNLIEDTEITLENLGEYIAEHLDPDSEESPFLLHDAMEEV